MVDDEGGAGCEGLAIEQLTFGGSPSGVVEGEEAEPEEELPSVALTQSLQGSQPTGDAGIGVTEDGPLQSLSDEPHVYRGIQAVMQRERFVRVVIWVIVVAMVLSLAVATLSLI